MEITSVLGRYVFHNSLEHDWLLQVQLEDGEFVDAEMKDFEAEDERGEFAPQVVELDEAGRERGLFCLWFV